MTDEELEEEIRSWTPEERAMAYCDLGLTVSRSEARRLVTQRADEKTVEILRDSIKKHVRARVTHTMDKFMSDPDNIAKLADAIWKHLEVEKKNKKDLDK